MLKWNKNSLNSLNMEFECSLKNVSRTVWNFLIGVNQYIRNKKVFCTIA